MARLLALVALAAGLVGAGCGGGSPRDDFVSAADRICEHANDAGSDVNAQLQALRSETDPQQAYAEMARLLGKAYDLEQSAQRDFEALDAPAGDEAKVDALNAAHQRQLDVLGRLVDAAKRQDPAALASLNEELASVSAESQRLSKGFGFEECGTG